MDTDEILDGAFFTAADINKLDLEALAEEGVNFTCDLSDVLEAHIFDNSILESFGNIGVGQWPSVEKQGEHLRLESVFGSGKESYLIVERAKISI